MGAAFFTLGETLIDAIAIGLVFNDENPAVRRRRRNAKEKHTGQERREESHAAPMNERLALIR
jgi:hypothetical protein